MHVDLKKRRNQEMPISNFNASGAAAPAPPLQRVSEDRVFREQSSEATEIEEEDNWRLTNTTTNTKPDVVDMASRPEVATVRRTAADRAAAPRPAPQNTRRTLLGRTSRVFLWARFVIIFIVPVRTPLVHIAMHVIQTERVRGVTADFTWTL